MMTYLGATSNLMNSLLRFPSRVSRVSYSKEIVLINAFTGLEIRLKRGTAKMSKMAMGLCYCISQDILEGHRSHRQGHDSHWPSVISSPAFKVVQNLVKCCSSKYFN